MESSGSALDNYVNTSTSYFLLAQPIELDVREDCLASCIFKRFKQQQLFLSTTLKFDFPWVFDIGETRMISPILHNTKPHSLGESTLTPS